MRPPSGGRKPTPSSSLFGRTRDQRLIRLLPTAECAVLIVLELRDVVLLGKLALEGNALKARPSQESHTQKDRHLIQLGARLDLLYRDAFVVPPGNDATGWSRSAQKESRDDQGDRL